MNPKLEDAIAHSLRVTGVSVGQAVEPRGNERFRPTIFQAQPPAPERLGLPELKHSRL